MFAARPHIRNEEQTGIVEHSAFALRHRVETAGEVRELAAIKARHPFVCLRSIIVGSGVMRRSDIEKWIKEARDIAAKQERGDAGFIRLKSERKNVAHQPHVLADVLRKTVIWPLH